mgnify:CR=1 FL=1
MFSKTQKTKILKTFNENKNKTISQITKKKLQDVAIGIYLNPQLIKKKSKIQLYNSLMEIVEENDTPIVHDDSMTTWGNLASEKYGLEIQDILKLKKNTVLNVIFFDRNVGDYMHGTKKGTKYDPRKKGLSYGKYTHYGGLVGKLEFVDIGVVHDPFIWEINLAAMNKKLFWGPIPIPDICKNQLTTNELIKKYKKKWEKMNQKIKVGWRGPSISVQSSKKMFKKVTHYDNWYNDYMPFRKHNFLK